MTLGARTEAEQAIVSFAFNDPPAFLKASAQVNPNDFIDRDLGRLCWVLSKLQASLDLRDLNAVLRRLQADGEIKTEGSASAYELARIASAGYLGSNVDFYIDRVLHYSKLDRIRRAAERLLCDCNAELEDTVVLDEAIANFQATANSVFKAKDESVKFVDLGVQLYEQINKPELCHAQKVLTGFKCIDDTAGGFFRGQLVLLSGRSFRGKTMLKMNIATKLARQGYKVAIHNLEMTDIELAERGFSDVAGIPYSRFVQGEFSTTNKQAMLKALNEVKDWPLWIHKSTSESISSLVAKIEYEHITKKLDVIFIDHLQRLENRSRQEKRHHLKDCCSQLKNLARKLNVVIVLLTQLRTVEGAKDEEPTEADYSESKQIVEEADLAAMLHRDPDEAGGKLIFVKVRKGRKCSEYLRLQGEYQRFYEAVPEAVADDDGDHYAQSDFDNWRTPNASY